MGARHWGDLGTQVELDYAVQAVYDSRLGTVARLAAEAADEDAFLVAVPAVQVFGPEFRDHLAGVRHLPAGSVPIVEPLLYSYDTELVTRFLRRSPDDEWLALDCVPRTEGTRCRRLLSEADEVSGRLRAALLTYGFGGAPAASQALGRTVARGALPWFGAEFAAAREDGVFTAQWWGDLLYPGGLWPEDTATVAADVDRLAAAAAVPGRPVTADS